MNDGDEVAAGTDPKTPDVFDSDGDGVNDDDDAFPYSDLGATVAIGACDAGAANALFDDGATMNDLLAAAAAGVRNHGAYVSAVSGLSKPVEEERSDQRQGEGEDHVLRRTVRRG